MKHKNFPVFIPHLACKNSCVFCNQKKIAGTLYPPTPDDVKSMLEKGLSTLQTDTEIAFFGGSFTGLDRDTLINYLKTAASFVKNGGYCGIRLSTRPDYITKEILEILKLYKVTTIELGVQSLDSEVLSKSKRGHTKEDVFKASELIKAYGFSLILQMMVGLPSDTRGKSIKTAEDIAKLKPDGVRIYPTAVIKDTELYDLFKAGEYEPLTLDFAVGICSELLIIFEKADIPVIRLGLHSDKELTSGGIAAGPYHPAFGEMCESGIYFDEIIKKLKYTDYKNIDIYCPAGEISKVTGNKRSNIIKLKQEYGLDRVKVKEDASLAFRNILIKDGERIQ